MSDSNKALEIQILIKLLEEGKIEEAKQKLQGVTEQTAQGAKETEKFNLSQREAGHILKELGEQAIPGAGKALFELRLGLLGVALAAGSVFEGVREEIKKTNEALDAMGERAAMAYSNVKKNLFDAINEEEFSTERVDKFFKKIEDDANSAKQAIETALAIAHEQESAASKALHAQEELALAQLKVNPEYASMTPQQRGAAELAIKNSFAQKQAEIERQGIQSDFDASYAQMRRTEEEKSRLEQMAKNEPVSAEMRKRIESYMASLPDNDATKQAFAADRAAGKVDYAAIVNKFQSSDIEEQLKSVRAKLGLDEQTGEMAQGGDAKKAEDDRKKNQALIDQENQYIANRQRDLKEIQARGDHSYDADYEHDIEAARKKIERYQNEIEKSEAAVNADQRRIQQLEEQAAIVKAQNDAQQKLKASIEKAQKEFETAWAEFEKTGQISDIKTKSVNAGAAADAALRGLNQAGQNIAGQNPNAIIEAGAQGQDDIEQLKREGYDQNRIIGDYRKAVIDQRTPGAFTDQDRGAMERYERYTRDTANARQLAALLEAMGQNGQEMRAIILHHLQLHTSTVGEVQALQNAFSVLQSRVQSMAGGFWR